MKKEHNYLGKKLIEIKEYKIIKQTYKIFIYHVKYFNYEEDFYKEIYGIQNLKLFKIYRKKI